LGSFEKDCREYLYFDSFKFGMTDYTIDVSKVEEFQTINNSTELEKIFARAKSAIVNGAKVLLIRRDAAGKSNKFDEIDNLKELEKYREQVFKYISE
jgi:hypothetical protein